MKQAVIVILAFIVASFGLAAYLAQPAILLVLLLIPSLLDVMPFGLLAQQHGADAVGSEDDYEDEAKPVGFTQDVKSKR